MKQKKSFSEFLGNIVHNNTFLKILSVFLALFAWIYILYIVDPVNTKDFDKVEVSMSFEGSVPDRNGFMYLLTDTNLTVNISVSGSRTELMNVSRSDIKATLNMDRVITEGTYEIEVNVNVDNDDITVVDVYPKTFTIQFAEVATRTLDLKLNAAGSLPAGYAVNSTSISPARITISGPKQTVNSINEAYLSVSLENVKEDISGQHEIALVDPNGNNVDRKYLTLSVSRAEILLDIIYRKKLIPTVALTNSSGGDESSYISVELNVDSLTATGDEKELGKLDKHSLGVIDSALISKEMSTIFPVPPIEGATFDTDSVTATVKFTQQTDTTTIYFSVEHMSCTNIPAGKSAIINTRELNVTLRTLVDDIDHFSSDNLRCLIDLSEPNEDGTYPVYVVTTNAKNNQKAFGIIGSYSVDVTVQ